MAVPKKKTSVGRSSRRYKTYVKKQHKKILDALVLVECPQCKEKKVAHQVCKTCGTYNGRQVLDMEKKTEKVTKVLA